MPKIITTNSDTPKNVTAFANKTENVLLSFNIGGEEYILKSRARNRPMNTDTAAALPKNAVILVALIATAALTVRLLWPENRQPPPPQPDISPSPASAEPVSPLPDFIPDLDPKKVALGKMLFYDTSLSQDNTIACATCHLLEQGGVDGKKFSIGIGGQLSLLNAPTVYNSGFNFRQFWNGRAETLEEQAAGPIHNPVEMGSNWTEVITKLNKSSTFVAIFSESYNNGITAENLADAIATFVRSLITPNARFDKYLKGDVNAITPYELSGYKLFTSYGCVACHQGMNIGGNMFEKLGVMRDYFADRGDIVEADKGRYSITNNPDDLYKFKVPSLRNVALTAPYFHDGTAPTLEHAVIVMGKYQLGISLPHDDVLKIAAFLRTLTGEYNGKPL